MKVKNLIALLNNRNPEAIVLVRMDGSEMDVDGLELIDDNGVEDEFFILAVDDFSD